MTAAPSSNTADRLASLILWGLLGGLVAGWLVRRIGASHSAFRDSSIWTAEQVLDPIGQVFLRLLFFTVVPLVFSSLALGVVQLGRLDRLGALAGKTFALFFFNMGVGVALGLLLMNLLSPGSSLDETTRAAMLTGYGKQAQALMPAGSEAGALSFRLLVEMFLPRNLLKAVTEFQVLPLIVFALLLGAAGTLLADTRRRHLAEALETLTQLMTSVVHFALLLAPVAVPCMICSVVIRFGTDFVGALLWFVVGVLGVMAIHLFGTMSLLLRVFTRRAPGAFFRSIRTIIVTAFSTSSSNATLPTSLQVAREELGISASTAGFVLPLGATMNMSGTALYEGCVVLFIAQVYGVDLSFAQQVVLLTLAVLSAVAVAGIPGGSLPLIVGLLTTFGVPAEGIALILGTDRLLDMARTVVNVGADVVTACIVDEGLGKPNDTTS